MKIASIRKCPLQTTNGSICALLVVGTFLMQTTAAPAQVAATLGMPRVNNPAPAPSAEDLVRQALATNPKLRRLRYQVQAAYERVPQLRSLPDPIFTSNVYAHPIETAAGSMRSSMTLAQKIPWLFRLSAQGQQAAVDAQALEQLLAAESLILAAKVRVAVYQLYVIEQKIRINKTNQTLVKQLSEIAAPRVAVGKATAGDVLRANLELSRLTAALQELEQQQIAVRARLNALRNLPAETPISAPERLFPRLNPAWTLPALRDLAWNNQPEIVASRLRQTAAELGIRIARLQQVPDLTFSVSTFLIQGNRPPSNIVNVGQDAWAIGVGLNIPLWNQKYSAMRREATAKYRASALEVQDVLRNYDAALADALAKARAAERVVRIYAKAILPQARQTLNADKQAYQTPGKVEFDRVITDFRNLINAEVGYHVAIGQFATALAQLEQLIGVPLQNTPSPNLTPGGNHHGPHR